MSRRTSEITTSTTTATNATSRESGSPNWVEDAVERADRVEQVVERQRVPDRRGTCPTISSSEMPRPAIALSIRPAASAITPDSASCS